MPLFAFISIIGIVGVNLQAIAQSRGASYLPPFPQGDAYNMMVIGDDFSYGLRHGLADLLAETPRVRLQPRPLHFGGLMRVNVENQVKKIEAALNESNIAIVVMMVGVRDAVSIRNNKGQRYSVASDVWNKEYARRVDAFMAMFKRKSIAAYWVGLPVTSRNRRNNGYQTMNGILRDRAFRNGLKFVDVYSGFGDEQDRFSPYGPDIQGETRLLRSRDGIFFTDAGNRKLAHFVERTLTRDLRQARRDRQIPLAGSATEQARIHAGRIRPPASQKPANTGSEADDGEAPAGSSPQVPGVVGAQRADHGKISLRLRQANGSEDDVVLDILRPAISASVIALVTRRATPNKRAEVGDTLVDNIPHDITVMSSITPSVSLPGGGNVLSPTQTPHFRVMVKGEALPPVEGRVDDFRWQESRSTTK